MFGLFGRSARGASKMETVNGRGTICASGLEYPCVIRKASEKALVAVLDRAVSLSGTVLIVDHKRGLALDATLSATKGNELTFDVRRSHDLRGLVPARLSRARDLWKRA